MFSKIVILALIVFTTQGDEVIMRDSRQGSFNTYVLYTREYDNARTPVPLPTYNELLADPGVEVPNLLNRDTVVIVHGHDGDQFTTLNPLVKDSFFDDFARPDALLNVIVVDWSAFTKQSYSVASAAVPSVGKALGEYLKLLMTRTYENGIATTTEDNGDDIVITTTENIIISTTSESNGGDDIITTTENNGDSSITTTTEESDGTITTTEDTSTTTDISTTTVTTTTEIDDTQDDIISTIDNSNGGDTIASKRTRNIVEEIRFALDQLHLIGFNLGAHVVGFAGRELGGQAARITGLDPSGSGWGSNSPRLSKSDARYVEVIHTDGNGLLANGIGTAIGDVDFFVNGGGNQPGCLIHSCCHNRAYELFAATLVRPTPLYGNLCNSQTQLNLNLCRGTPIIAVGGDAMWKRHGLSNLYRVNTGRSFPY